MLRCSLMAKPQPCRLPFNVPAELDRSWNRAPPGRQVVVRNELLRRLHILLDFDERRPRPPVTLPGRPRAVEESAPAPAPASAAPHSRAGGPHERPHASALKSAPPIDEPSPITVGADRLLTRLQRFYGEARTDIAPQLQRPRLRTVRARLNGKPVLGAVPAPLEAHFPAHQQVFERLRDR